MTTRCEQVSRVGRVIERIGEYSTIPLTIGLLAKTLYQESTWAFPTRTLTAPAADYFGLLNATEKIAYEANKLSNLDYAIGLTVCTGLVLAGTALQLPTRLQQRREEI